MSPSGVLIVLLYERGGVPGARKHPYGLLVGGGCFYPLRGADRRVVPGHLSSFPKRTMPLMYPLLRAPKRPQRQLRLDGVLQSWKFSVAIIAAGAAISTRQRHGEPHQALKRSGYVLSVAPPSIKGLRLVTPQLYEKSSPSEAKAGTTSGLRLSRTTLLLNGHRCNGCGAGDRDPSPVGPRAHPSSPVRRSWDSTTYAPAR
jgi:hypothetical protein